VVLAVLVVLLVLEHSKMYRTPPCKSNTPYSCLWSASIL
jgi:hypothetical protein